MGFVHGFVACVYAFLTCAGITHILGVILNANISLLLELISSGFFIFIYLFLGNELCSVDIICATVHCYNTCDFI